MKQIKQMVTIVLLNFILLAITVFVVGNITNLTTIFASILGVEPQIAQTTATNTITTQSGGQQANSTTKNTVAKKPVLPKNACVITIDNLKYNITPFRKKHSGGDIFVCNSNMTKTFYQNHKKNYLDQMKPYLI